MTAFDEDETLSTLKAMRRQEEAYNCQDYCKLHGIIQQRDSVEDDRKKMAEWATNLVDFANLSRETVEIAMSYADRFLQTDHGQHYIGSASRFQLLLIVSLFLALKTHGTAYISLRVFQEISHGQYDIDQMLEMEQELLQALKWRVNPPTTTSFLRLFLTLVPSVIMDHDMKGTACYLSHIQTEQAIRDYNLVTVRASDIALAALKNSLESLGVDDHDIASVTSSIQQAWDEPDELDYLQTRLYEAIASRTHNMQLHRRSESTESVEVSGSSKVMAARRAFEEDITPRSTIFHPMQCS